MWFRISGAPLYSRTVLASEGRPEIWVQCCFYKEPIGPRFRAGPPGAAHKARERWAPARARPERFFKICGFLWNITGCWFLAMPGRPEVRPELTNPWNLLHENV